MDEDSIILPVTPNSAEADGGNSRRLSLGQASSSNSREKIVPHYLRASTGSCHDFCKYGKKHAFEEKARRPFCRKNIKKPPDDSKFVLLESKISPVVKLKSSPNSKTHISNTSEIIKSEALTKSVDSQMPLLAKLLVKKKTSPEVLLTQSVDGQGIVSREVTLKSRPFVRAVPTRSVGSQSSVASETGNEKKKAGQGGKTTPVFKRTLPDLRTPSSSKGINQNVSSSSEKLETPLQQTPSKPKEKLSARISNHLKTSSPSEDSKATSGRKNSDIKKGLKGLPKGLNKVQASPRALVSPKTTSIAIRRGLASPRASLPVKISTGGVSRGVASPRASLSLSRTASLNKKHKDLKAASSSKNQSKITNADAKKLESKRAYPIPDQPNNEGANEDVVHEKTLHVIRMETGNKCLESDYNENLSAVSSPPQMISSHSQSLQNSPPSSSHNEEDEESQYSVTEGEDDLSEYEETEEEVEAESLEGDQKGKHVKVGMITSKDKDGHAIKLRFRRGKVVDIQSENNGPRRLKFRRGRILGENPLKADARKSFKRRGADSSTIDGNDSEKVVLRHQEVHGKKDAQGLFNNVIEETASKLVETRKSKVKALVGAFETVISLQDTKPSANATS